jgi:hypothetical protein
LFFKEQCVGLWFLNFFILCKFIARFIHDMLTESQKTKQTHWKFDFPLSNVLLEALTSFQTVWLYIRVIQENVALGIQHVQLSANQHPHCQVNTLLPDSPIIIYQLYGGKRAHCNVIPILNFIKCCTDNNNEKMEKK